LGSGLPVSVSAGQPFIPFESRYDQSGPVLAGDALLSPNEHGCTAGYSARTPNGTQQGATTYQYFVLTAGHCYTAAGIPVGRPLSPSSGEFGVIGKSARNGLNTRPYVDAGTVTIDANLRSHSVLNRSPLEGQTIQGIERPVEGRRVCWSAVSSGNHCGHIRFFVTIPTSGGKEVLAYVADGETESGDSGGPVWDPDTHKAVGLIVGSSPDFAHCETTPLRRKRCDKMAFTPLRVPSSPSAGAEAKLGVQVLVKEE
jgi:hypothetical protein